MTDQYVRAGALALAAHTGWSCAEIMNMRSSRFIWWLDGLPRED
nr:MAG TPA: hypothetical protein [Caudoviricetes sp.]